MTINEEEERPNEKKVKGKKEFMKGKDVQWKYLITPAPTQRVCELQSVLYTKLLLKPCMVR
jgi:hypothetical protein